MPTLFCFLALCPLPARAIDFEFSWLWGPTLQSHGAAFDINNSGRIFGYFGNSTDPLPEFHDFFYRPETGYQVSPQSAYYGHVEGQPMAEKIHLNDAAEVFVGASFSVPSPFDSFASSAQGQVADSYFGRPAIYYSGEVTELMQGFSSGGVADLNDVGWFDVPWSAEQASGMLAALWIGDYYYNLNAFAPPNSFLEQAINNLEQIVGVSRDEVAWLLSPITPIAYLDGNGVVDNFDIQPFELALTGFASFRGHSL